MREGEREREREREASLPPTTHAHDAALMRFPVRHVVMHRDLTDSLVMWDILETVKQGRPPPLAQRSPVAK